MSLPMTIMRGKLFTTSVENLKLGMWLDMRDDIRVLYNAVQSWQLAFNWEQAVNFQVRDVCAHVLTDMAWVTMKTYVGDHLDTGPFNVTNVFEFHNARWYMVHHHSSVLDEVEHQNA